MGLFDDYFDPDQFQDSGGLFGRLLSLHPELDFQSGDSTGAQNPPGASVPAQPMQPILSQASPGAVAAASPSANADIDRTSPPAFDLGAHLNAGFQKWAQTPAGNPFAAIANGIAGFNAAQPADAAFIGPPAPPVQTPDFDGRVGAALQSWAQTPAGNPFAAIANGITGFNTGQASASGPSSLAGSSSVPCSKIGNNSNAAVQYPQNPPLANVNPLAPLQWRRAARRWPQ